MDRMLYVAMAGARQIDAAQAANAHNLANASTVGFRADLLAFQARPLRGPGYPTRVYPIVRRVGTDLSPGEVTATGRALDVAVNGEGWIAVQAPDGTEAYTRRGDLRVNTHGILETGDGRPVLGEAGPIALPPAETIEIAADGTISIRPVGQSATELVVVDRIRLVRPDRQDLVKGADGLMHLKDGATAAPDARVQLVSGSIESSNVSPVDALVNRRARSRQFEIQIRLMREAGENDAASARMMRLR